MILLFSLLASLLALAYGVFLIWQVLKKPQGNDRMRPISQVTQEGASTVASRRIVGG